MFAKISHRLLLSYLLVLASILIVFILGVRVAFTRSLERQLIENLTIFAEAAADNVEIEGDRLKIENDFLKQNSSQDDRGLEWFNREGNLIYKTGKAVVNLPFSPKRSLQIQTGVKQIQALTLPIVSARNGTIIGYVRTSQSLKNFHDTVEKLDWVWG